MRLLVVSKVVKPQWAINASRHEKSIIRVDIHRPLSIPTTNPFYMTKWIKNCPDLNENGMQSILLFFLLN